MNQATQTRVQGQPSAQTEPLTVVIITARSESFDTIAADLANRDNPYRAVQIDAAARVADDAPNAVALYCLECTPEADTARREIALIGNLAGDTPLLLIDPGDLALSHEAAVAAGATDVVALDAPGVLSARLHQALDLGRARLELRDIGQRLNQAQRRLDVLLSQRQDARASLIGHRIADASPAFARLLGAGDALAAKGQDLIECAVENDRGAVANAIDQVIDDQNNVSLVFELERANAQHQSVRALLEPGVDQNAGEGRVNIVLQVLDGGGVSGTVRRSALDGRMALHAVLAQTTERSQDRALGLVFAAIDEISQLQDQMGLAQSDLVLQEVGLFLLQFMRDGDRVFRFGAGEYVLLLERHSRTEIAEAAERLHAALGDELFGDERRSATLSASMAHTLLTGDAAEHDRRLQRLMDAAHEAREDGGNECRQCGDGDDHGKAADPADTQQWVARLREALTHDRFSLAYQGITSLAGDSQPYFDCLLRYVDDRGALVRPGEFLGAAERAELMPEIDRWVARRAMAVIHQQKARSAHIALFVKLSSATLGAAQPFLTWLRETSRAQPIPHDQLVFSMREDDIRVQTQAAQRLAEELDTMGFRVALTHYGSTAQAAQVLDRMPAAFIKLSPSFARQILGSEEDERLARIIATARKRQIPLIAEQIEDANSMARLWQAGVNYVQGHFIQEPDTEALARSESRLV